MFNGSQGGTPTDGLHLACVLAGTFVLGPKLGPIVGTAARKLLGS